MSSIQRDYSIFDKFNFERNPVGVKFLLKKPDGIERLDKNLAFCQMFREAQDRSPFYAVKENFACVGPILLGMVEPDPVSQSGQIGHKLGIFKEPRANRRIYENLPRLAKDTVKYVAFSSLHKLAFDPDVLIITANPSQAAILLRAISYTTGKILSSKIPPALSCAWLYVYPYISGEFNFTITGLGSGMRRKQVLPEGLILLSIPYDFLSNMIENLQDMKWPLPSDTTEGEYKTDIKSLVEELRQELLDS